MIIFDPSKTLLFNVGINVFSCIIVFILLYNVKRNFADTYDARLLRKIGVSILLVLLTDTASWILNGQSGSFLRILNYANTILYFIIQIAIAHRWLRYAWYRIFNKKLSKMKEIIYIIIPFTFLSLIVLSAPLNGWCFYLDNANYYHRGVLSMPMSIVILAYLLSVTVVSLTQYKKESLNDRKAELLTITFFAIPPFLGGFIQMMFFGLSMIWPCAVISSLLILLNKQSQAISQDALTGLNNRRNMEKVFRIYEEGQNRAVTLIMLDINNFKLINDKYGHSLGDNALIHTANILRATFRGTTAFLSRYGGDEFVIILPGDDEDAAKKAVQRIRDNFDNAPNTKQLPFQVSVSIGYDISSKQTRNKLSDLLKKADESMYKDKALHHQTRHT